MNSRPQHAIAIPASQRHGPLHLTIWSPRDAADMASWWARNRPHLQPTHGHRLETHWTTPGQKERIQANADAVKSGHLVPLLIREYGVLVGEVILESIAGPAFSRSASIGYAVDASRLRCGIATAAVHAAINLAFSDLGISIIETTTDVSNVGSQEVLRRNGFERVVGSGRRGLGATDQVRWRLERGRGPTLR